MTPPAPPISPNYVRYSLGFGTGAGPGVTVILDRTTVAPGDVVQLRLLANPPPGGSVDLYVVVALPPSFAPSLGCGNSLPLVFVTNGGSAVTPACLSNPPNSFPRYVGSTTLSTTATLLSVIWSAAALPGDYVFAAVVTPAGALADGVIGPGDILSAPTDHLTVP